MNIHRRILVLVGLGMLLITSIALVSLQEMTAVFSRTTGDVEMITLRFHKVWEAEKETADLLRHMHAFIESGDAIHRHAYEFSIGQARRTLTEMSRLNLDQRERSVLSSLSTDLDEMEKKAKRIFSLREPATRSRALARAVMSDMDGLSVWMRKDVEKYIEEEAVHLDSIREQLHGNRVRVVLLFVAILVAAISFLLVFGLYLHRKISAPWRDLWKGTEEISRGNLDHRILLRGESDITPLAERFNEMSQKLKRSYAELEQRLLDRTRELAALDSVALTLGQSGNMNEVLQKSLDKILNSLAGIEAKGGVFLCDPDGEHLRLMAQKGLTPDFARQEETIKLGECLCGRVAQSGELLFTEPGCRDERHLRGVSENGHSHIIIPLKSRGIVLGVVFLYPSGDFRLKPSDVQMLDSIGAQLGMAIENHRFYQEVKESSEKFWDLFENARDILFTMDLGGRLTAVNKAAEKFMGLSKIELTGKSVLDFLTVDGAAVAAQLVAGKRVSMRKMLEFEVVKKDASHAFVEVSARRMLRNRTPIGYQVSARDVTEQRKLRELIVKAERLGAIGQVGIAVRHEINNPLTTIIGNAELLLERQANSPDDLKIRLEVILSNALRIAEIIKRLEGIKQDKVVEYLKGVKMTDLK